jgi:hypothetical protein
MVYPGAAMVSARGICWLILLPLLSGEIVMFAQIGGPFPGGGYPPGGYPPGRYPGGGYPGGGYPGGGGIPLPGRKKKNPQKDDSQPLLSIAGMMRKLNDTQLVLEAEDTRIISLKRSEKTKFLKDGDPMKSSDLKPGDHLQIDATQDEQGYYSAVTVNFEKAGTPAERAAASQPVEVSTQSTEGGDDDERPRLRRAGSPQEQESAATTPGPTPVPPSPKAQTQPASQEQEEEPPRPTRQVASDKPLPPAAPDPDDPGRPVLRRGKPAAKRTTASTTQVASAEPPASAAPDLPARSEDARAPLEGRPAVLGREASRAPDGPPIDPMIGKAIEAAESFTETLPNYVCQQFTARFVTQSHVTNWQAIDVVSAEVLYENGKESYRNLQINGKPVKKGMEELSGAWSTGEFGTLLRDLFSPATAAEFHFRKDSVISGMSAALYDFKVEHENSHWRVQVPSQSVFPAYKGSVWIDKKNGRVLRIEMQARNVPSEFPLDTVETVADYEYVRIGGSQQFLLPVHSETLSCQRGTNNCSRNSIDFRNYKKYSGEATITFDK